MADIREIVMDTETTGLEPQEGHRIVEIGALELINHVPTGRTYHQYINPLIKMPPEAEAIHGISDADLADKPVFADVSQAFLRFIEGGTLVIHNAPFDIKFLNAEFAKVGAPPLNLDDVTDTLAIARKRFPGAQNSLDGLSRRFGIDTSKRVKHGALLDSEILADVYLELRGGRQSRMAMEVSGTKTEDAVDADYVARARPSPLPSLLTEGEAERHAAFVAEFRS
jgi:DNA polymerase-3 subunit epsilon